MFARAKMSARAFPFLCCPLISLPLPFLSHPTPDPDLDPSHPDPRASTGHLRQSNPRPPTRPWPMPGPVVFQHVPLAITSLRATFRVGPGQFLESKITQNCSCAKRSFQELPWIQNPPSPQPCDCQKRKKQFAHEPLFSNFPRVALECYTQNGPRNDAFARNEKQRFAPSNRRTGRRHVVRFGPC